MPRLTKAQLKQDSAIHNEAISNYVNSWLKYYGFKIGDRVVAKKQSRSEVGADPRQLSLFKLVSMRTGGRVEGVVVYPRKAYLLVKMDGDDIARAFDPLIFKNELDILP